jgi:hypothetical protein
MLTLWEMPKQQKVRNRMFIGKYISIFVDGGYQIDLEKR